MTALDWRWKIGEAVERLRTRYRFIGRMTGAPFLGLVYPTEAEATVLKEWRTQTSALRPEIDVRSINVLDVTQAVLSEIGAEAIVDALTDPMPGSNPQSELSSMHVRLKGVDRFFEPDGGLIPIYCTTSPAGGWSKSASSPQQTTRPSSPTTSSPCW